MTELKQIFAIVTILILGVVLAVTTVSYFQLVDLIEKFGINKIKEIEFKETEWYYTKNGWISNSDRKINHAVPGDRLHYEITFVSKVPYDVNFENNEFRVLFNGEQVAPPTNFGIATLMANQEQRISGDFFTTREGIHELQWVLQLRDENGMGDLVVETNDVDAWSLSNVLQEEDNQTNQLGSYAAIIIGAATVAALFVNIWYSKQHTEHLKEQNDLLYDSNVIKTKESQALVKADLRLNLINSDNRTRHYDGKDTNLFRLTFNIENKGKIQADSVKVFYKIYDQPFSNLQDILDEKDGIHKTKLDTQGDILPNETKSYTILRRDFEESKVRYVILWIEFGYDVFDNNVIYQIVVRGGEKQHDIHSTYSNDNIETTFKISEK